MSVRAEPARINQGGDSEFEASHDPGAYTMKREREKKKNTEGLHSTSLHFLLGYEGSNFPTVMSCPIGGIGEPQTDPSETMSLKNPFLP